MYTLSSFVSTEFTGHYYSNWTNTYRQSSRLRTGVVISNGLLKLIFVTIDIPSIPSQFERGIEIMTPPFEKVHLDGTEGERTGCTCSTSLFMLSGCTHSTTLGSTYLLPASLK